MSNLPTIHILLAVEIKVGICQDEDHMMVIYIPRGVTSEERDPDNPDFAIARLTSSHPALTVLNPPENNRINLDMPEHVLCMN